jgi:hypothetical protein
MPIATFDATITQLTQQDGTVMVRVALEGGGDIYLPVAADAAASLTIGQTCTLALAG